MSIQHVPPSGKNPDLKRPESQIQLSSPKAVTGFNCSQTPCSLSTTISVKVGLFEDDPVTRTGIFAHNAQEPLPYRLLLSRLYLLQVYYPSLNTYTKNEVKTLAPYIVVDGKKRTVVANFSELCKSLERNKDHVFQYLLAELGTSGSFDSHERVIMKGRFHEKQIKRALQSYRRTYVECPSCESRATDLRNPERRVWIVNCRSCGKESRAPVIKTGYTLRIGCRPQRPKNPPQEESEPESRISLETLRTPRQNCFTRFKIKSKL
ncbi:uncharacterized protein BDR25DRAFT_304509 [Lindgomyces ingoldianus]|uniref:Uncharacterized protein n=1 Tax=Lindgomyces ingoldianus TaxID=673940 RepID=A0ACB6QQX0_9PLEO|nr:uncharacterized protein BDR25DRAFT_304509 [Lindgomyces ingoldianus]KAF2469414.1 hypothetical protein BDR25DRAFT_304509 [Lindgomyces ingoldianus]